MASSEVGIACSGPSSPDNVSFTSYVLLFGPSPCDRLYRLRVLWANLTPRESSAALLLVGRAYPVWRVNSAFSLFRLRPTWVCVSAGVDSLAVCHAAARFVFPFQAGNSQGLPSS